MSDTIETQEEAVNVKDDNLAELLAVLSTYEDAPDELTVEAWKDNYGKIFVSSVLGDDSIYVWRTINRQEYKQMVNNGIVKNPMLYEETVVRRCIRCWSCSYFSKTDTIQIGICFGSNGIELN